MIATENYFWQTRVRTSRGLLMALFAFAILYADAARATKAEGQFSIAAKIDGNHAAITIATHVAAHELELQLSGSDGLEVQGAQPSGALKVKTFKRADLAPGQTWSVEIDLTSGEGLSYLNVLVTAKGQAAVV